MTRLKQIEGIPSLTKEELIGGIVREKIEWYNAQIAALKDPIDDFTQRLEEMKAVKEKYEREIGFLYEAVRELDIKE